ncbi:hypothetical protein J1792_14960 [Streptomyces triculaminicus]|uniref:Uncharacterized protein n=2 Tax=Streptomyces TaxID=1883 RepID=A0A939JMC1_9ACTN|nr:MULTISPECIES: hypothetical protein [Streptomyces]MBO0654026.1 hypothetical protein [Streptomyces triculaminicus]QSY48764.1 hypothetical protein J3S04_27615 [Streptomyces griseocarneus]
MKLRFLGKNSTPGDSPTLYATDRDSYVVQGWKVYAHDLLTQLEVPVGHTAVEVPPELFEHLTKDGYPSGKVRRFEAPIMLVTEQGTCVVQGPAMTDAEALGQMRMPDYETCIEVAKSSITALLEENSGPDHQR